MSRCRYQRFGLQIPPGHVSQIWITWLKLMSNELRYLPLREQIYATLPNHLDACIQKGVSSLIVLKFNWKYHLLWKQVHTYGVIINTTACLRFWLPLPNCVVPWVSPCYGGCTSDIIIVRNSGVFDLLQPYDTAMTDCSFKIKS